MNAVDDNEIPLAVFFPLPFRALFLIGLGVLGWATNLHGLHALGIDAASAFELDSSDGQRTPLPTSRRHTGFRFFPHQTTLYAPVYRLFVAYAIWCFLSWCTFRWVSHGDLLLVDVFKYIPAITILGAVGVLVCPFDVLQKRERDIFLLALRRCLFAPSNHPIYFSDVVLADILTSFAKVFGDIWLSLLMLWPGGSLLLLPRQEGLSQWVLPTLMSLPYAIRLRQCLIEYRLPTNESRKPLWNAVKYATSFPVIYLSAAQRIVVSELVAEKGQSAAREAWHGEHGLFRVWLLAAVVNSLYSFWWDLTNDWGLDLLRFQVNTDIMNEARVPRPLVLPSLHSRSESITRAGGSLSIPSTSAKDDLVSPLSPGAHSHTQPYPFGLRPILLYPLPTYPLLIFLNLVLRLTWSIKLSPHLHSSTKEGTMVVFGLECAEVIRRWMWVFVRVEWQVISRMHDGWKGRHRAESEEEFELLAGEREAGD